MAMSYENVIQVFEADTRLQDLALGALTAIDQKAELIMLDHLGRKPAFGRGSRGGGAEEDNFIH